MEYKVKGLTFTMEELNSIPLLDVKTQTIARSHYIYFLPGNKIPVLLLRAGDFIETEFVAKYKERGIESLYELPLVKQEVVNKYRHLWHRLSQSQTQQEQFQTRDEIIKNLAKDYFEKQDKSFLSFTIACFEEFYFYPSFVLDKLQTCSMTLYSRSLLISSLSTVTAIINGYCDYKFVKDFYNVSFVMDYGLVEYSDFNYTIGLACEKERQVPGAGIQILDQYKRPASERRIFFRHPIVSREFAQTQVENFTHPELIDLIELHHEKTDGSGFPHGHSYSALSDGETLLTFADYMVPFSEHQFKKGDGHVVLFDYFGSLKNMQNQNLIPVKKTINNWDSLMKWAIEAAKKMQDQEPEQAPEVDPNAFGEAA